MKMHNDAPSVHDYGVHQWQLKEKVFIYIIYGLSNVKKRLLILGQWYSNVQQDNACLPDTL
jgi:hypothetical protein